MGDKHFKLYPVSYKGNQRFLPIWHGRRRGLAPGSLRRVVHLSTVCSEVMLVAISGKAKGEERHEGNAGRQGSQAADALAEADRGSGIVSYYFFSSIVTATAPTAESRTLLPSTSATRVSCR
jgi:hypothetical protein